MSQRSQTARVISSAIFALVFVGLAGITLFNAFKPVASPAPQVRQPTEFDLSAQFVIDKVSGNDIAGRFEVLNTTTVPATINSLRYDIANNYGRFEYGNQQRNIGPGRAIEIPIDTPNGLRTTAEIVLVFEYQIAGQPGAKPMQFTFRMPADLTPGTRINPVGCCSAAKPTDLLQQALWQLHETLALPAGKLEITLPDTRTDGSPNLFMLTVANKQFVFNAGTGEIAFFSALPAGQLRKVGFLQLPRNRNHPIMLQWDDRAGTAAMTVDGVPARNLSDIWREAERRKRAAGPNQ